MTSLSQTADLGGRILVASADQKDCADIRINFEREGYRIDCIPSLPDVRSGNLGEYTLILMELPSDVTSGLHAIEKIRQTGSCAYTPLLVFSQSNKSDVLVEALNAGADDYIIKPFSLRELTARVRAVLRSARRG